MFAEPRLGVIESAKVIENNEVVDIYSLFPLLTLQDAQIQRKLKSKNRLHLVQLLLIFVNLDITLCWATQTE